MQTLNEQQNVLDSKITRLRDNHLSSIEGLSLVNEILADLANISKRKVQEMRALKKQKSAAGEII